MTSPDTGMGHATVTAVNGPVVTAEPSSHLTMGEMVEVGPLRLVGEVIGLQDQKAVIQVYEDTIGLTPGTMIEGTGMPLSVELGPGLIAGVFDGIQRPLNRLRESTGAFMARGSPATPLSRDRLFPFTPSAKIAEEVGPGTVIGTVAETHTIEHRVMVPPGTEGAIEKIAPKGEYTLDAVVAIIKDSNGKEQKINLYHRWPVRVPRPCLERLEPDTPLMTGQRVIDTLFPVTKGGTAAIPGGFGTGKTITQHQLAKWADADIIVYIGCGERGNEMTSVLKEFPALVDPRTDRPLMERTVLIANTSDMPVAAREASIYTGVTIAEYYRDMGYDVALMADSTSRWAEALREVSGRLEEMPAEEGFPPYLASRLAAFYERASQVTTLNGRKGSVTIVGAVSPPGGDFSEPVTMHTKRFVQCFWSLDKELAGARHFPAINYLDSYSFYRDKVAAWWKKTIDPSWDRMCREARAILQKETKLQNIIRLLGEEALPDDQKIIIKGAWLIKESFLQQSAFDEVDTYASPQKQFLMLDTILHFIRSLEEVIRERIPLFRALELPVVTEITRMKYQFTGEDEEPFSRIKEAIDQQVKGLLEKNRS